MLITMGVKTKVSVMVVRGHHQIPSDIAIMKSSVFKKRETGS